MKFLTYYKEEKLPDGFVLDLLKKELDGALEEEDSMRAKQIKELMDQLISDNDEYKKKYALDEYWWKDLIKENNDTNLGKFVINKREFSQYMNQIKKILAFMYPKSDYETITTEDGSITVLKALQSEKDAGRDYSVLNKVNTNIKLMIRLVNKFDLKSFVELVMFVRANREDLFTDNGKYFHIVYDTIRSTELVGEKNEERACEHIKDIIKKRFSIVVDPVREVTSSYKDMVLGIDITFTIKGKDYTCQVKPLMLHKTEGDNIKVRSSGRIKPYKTDYIAFVGYTDILLFRNNDVSINGSILTIPATNLVVNNVRGKLK